MQLASSGGLTSTVTGTTVGLTGTASGSSYSSGGLTYEWTVSSARSGAPAPTFSANGTNAAATSTATFGAAGAYAFQVTVTDPSGQSSTSSVDVSVDQTLTSISVTPGAPTLGSAATQQFAATALDQFGNAMATQPTFTWSNSGAGSVNSSGLYTAPAAAGSDTVSASGGGVTGSAPVAVVGPSVATPASALTADGVDVSLSVIGSDPNGESTLTYTWAATSSPNGEDPDYTDNGDNSAKGTTAYIEAPGTYTFQVTISDGTNTATSSASITVGQIATSVQINQPGAAVINGGTFPFTATAYDQFGNALATQPAFTWSVSGAGGTISSGGTYTAPSSGTGMDTVVVSTGGVSANALVETGPVVGNVYDDGNDDSTLDDGEQGLQDWNVFVDLNGDGADDAGDPSTLTDADGNFAIDPSSGGSGSGSAVLRAVAPTGWSLTQGAAGYTVSTTGAASGYDSFGAYAAPSLSDNGASPLSVVVGQTFTSTIASFFDSAGAESNPASFSATVTWGDGTHSAGAIVPQGGGDYTVTGTHAYTTAGSYAASVAITGSAGDSLTTSVTAAVSNAAPVLIPIADQDPAPGSPLTISVPFTDADPLATFTATVDWGDGNGPQPATVTDGTVTATLADVPSQPLNATVTLTDQYGGTTTVGVPINDSATVADGSTPDDISTPDTITSAPYRLWTVAFGATDPDRFHVVRQDGTNNVYGPAASPANSLGQAEWGVNPSGADPGYPSFAYPICYTRSGTKYGDVVPTAGANIIMPTVASTTDVYQVYAVDGAGITWGPVNASVSYNPTYGNILSAAVTCTGMIVSHVGDCAMTLSWFVLDTTASTKSSAGTTQNVTYVTLNDPTTQWTYTGALNAIPPSPSHPADPIAAPFETVLYLACAFAQGATTANQVINGTWSNFEKSLTSGVTDAHGTHMTYWGSASGNVTGPDLDAYHTTTGLLANHDGRCEAWAGLFVDVLRAQGISAREYGILPKNPSTDTPPSGYIASTSTTLGKVTGIQVNSGLAGQGNASPQSEFDGGHVVVELGGGLPTDALYDPSYGKYYANLASWAYNSLYEMQWTDAASGIRYAPRTVTGNGDVMLMPYL